MDTNNILSRPVGLVLAVDRFERRFNRRQFGTQGFTADYLWDIYLGIYGTSQHIIRYDMAWEMRVSAVFRCYKGALLGISRVGGGCVQAERKAGLVVLVYEIGLVLVGWVIKKGTWFYILVCLFRKNVFITVISFQHVSPSPLFGL